MAEMSGEKPAGDPPETGAENTGQEPPPGDPPNEPPPAEAQNDIPTETKPAPSATEEKWERKYTVLQAKYDAEVPRLHAQLREMQGQITQLIEAKAQAEAKAAQAPEPVKSVVTEQDKEAFGSDLIDLIERATEAKVGTLRDREAKLLEKIEKLEGQLGNVSERQSVSTKEQFMMSLSQKVPDWEKWNTDPGFLEWLSEIDPVYGVPRQAALNTAYESFDVTRVSSVFNAYKALVAPKQQAEKPKANQELQRQVAPSRSRASTAPTTSEANSKIWAQAEIQQFYDEWRRGFINDTDAARIEAEISAAITEGRVR